MVFKKQLEKRHTGCLSFTMSFVFSTTPCLGINAYFPHFDMVCFQPAEVKKKWLACTMYTALQDYVIIFLNFLALNMILFELLASGWCWYELVHHIPMLTVGWSFHSLLLVELFIDAFTFFPRVLFGLAAQVWGLGLGFSIPHIQTCCYKVDYHIYS